ncbi:MAG: MarR family transcriptional regulator [Planctomycetia bacterium]|nr:MarR family transcriptional regulator [Planctomycetia bacterium]
MNALTAREGSGSTDSGSVESWAELLESLAGCNRRLREELALHLVRRGLSEGEFSLLWSCRSWPGGVHQAQIAERLRVSTAAVSQAVEHLRTRELLASRRAPPDRRRQYWTLTPQGEALLRSVLDDLLPWVRDQEERFGARNRAELQRLVSLLAARPDANRKAA